MPVIISDEDYKEYRVLQHNALFQQKLDSVRGMKNLKDDIDVPIRKLVAMFALLGCEPQWSCCGFDYDGQPMHKTHEYGDVYIALTNSERTLQVMATLINYKIIKLVRVEEPITTNDWYVWRNAQLIIMRSDFDYFQTQSNYPWTMHSCIHFSELATIQIYRLEQAILKLFNLEFLESEVLQDTNHQQKKHLYNWQYPTLEDWVVTKEDIL